MTDEAEYWWFLMRAKPVLGFSSVEALIKTPRG